MMRFLVSRLGLVSNGGSEQDYERGEQTCLCFYAAPCKRSHHAETWCLILGVAVFVVARRPLQLKSALLSTLRHVSVSEMLTPPHIAGTAPSYVWTESPKSTHAAVKRPQLGSDAIPYTVICWRPPRTGRRMLRAGARPLSVGLRDAPSCEWP
jgi:hypothetical protein